jgi:hypothetical protein
MYEAVLCSYAQRLSREMGLINPRFMTNELFSHTFLILTKLKIGFFCDAVGIAATPGLLCQPRVIVKMIVEKQMECRLAGESEVLGENLSQRHLKTGLRNHHAAYVSSPR